MFLSPGIKVVSDQRAPANKLQVCWERSPLSLLECLICYLALEKILEVKQACLSFSLICFSWLKLKMGIYLKAIKSDGWEEVWSREKSGCGNLTFMWGFAFLLHLMCEFLRQLFGHKQGWNSKACRMKSQTQLHTYNSWTQLLWVAVSEEDPVLTAFLVTRTRLLTRSNWRVGILVYSSSQSEGIWSVTEKTWL